VTRVRPVGRCPDHVLAVGLMGALVAGLSVYFTYRGRHNQFRQVVYGRQMDAYFDISESMSNLFTAAQNILGRQQSLDQGEDARARFRTALREEHERFTGTVNRSLIVLPSKVKAAVDNFNETAAGDQCTDRRAPTALHDAAADVPRTRGEDVAKAYRAGHHCHPAPPGHRLLTTGMLNEMGIAVEIGDAKGFRSGVNPLVPVDGRPL